ACLVVRHLRPVTPDEGPVCDSPLFPRWDRNSDCTYASAGKQDGKLPVVRRKPTQLRTHLSRIRRRNGCRGSVEGRSPGHFIRLPHGAPGAHWSPVTYYEMVNCRLMPAPPPLNIR